MPSIGVEAAYGFGDGLFLAPLIQAIAEKHQQPVEVAVQAQCADAFHNLPWISKITHIRNLHDGMAKFKSCDKSYQITPNIHFPRFLESDPSHSLIDTALLIGRSLGLEIDQRPIFLPTSEERITLPGVRPRIAIESHHKSGQSWANPASFLPIVNKYRDTHDILWLSNRDAPPGVNDLSGYTRRQIITLLHTCETFFSVGSGFFCASMALELPPPRIVCLWIDDYYHYERRLAELGWHKNIVWVHNQSELEAVL